MDRGPQVLSHEIEITDTDNTNAYLFELAEDQYGRILWDQGSVPAEDAEPGEELIKTWTDFGGGMGETYDLEERIGYKTGAYYFSDNCQVTDPYRIRPRQALTSVTLTNNNAEVTHLFEAKSASGIKYLYALTDTHAYKIQISGTPALKNTKDFSTPDVAFATGSYTSDGATRTIPTDFPVKAVIIKAINGAYAAVIKTDDMGANSYKDITGTHTAGGTSDYLVVAASGFAFAGTDTGFNHSGTTYCWMAFGGEDAYVKTGTFTGNATDDRDIEVDSSWGQPDALFIFTDNDSDGVCFRNKTDTADSTCDLNTAGATIANIVEATADWPTDGFEVGDDNRSNRNAATVYYLALKAKSNILEIGSHTGDGVDPQAVTGLGYAPTWVLIYTDSGWASAKAVHRSDRCASDSTMLFGTDVNYPNFIQSLDSDGYSVGDSHHVNQDTKTYYYLALIPPSTPTCGQPAEWNGIWELPQGDDVDRVALTTIVDGTGNDTWTARSTGEAKVQQFGVVENELIAARSDRIVSKCSATDTDVDGNWTGDYNVGQPGTKITKLVNVAGECGVGTTDGFYLWDTVSTSRQQLPLLGGITDDENAKGTTVVGNLVLIPTVDGDWRWVAGSAVPFGPDSNDGYVEVEGPTVIPIEFKHYDHAFLGRYIYHACYDGWEWNIIYTKLNLNDPTLARAKWDFLFTAARSMAWPAVSTTIKELHIDTERRLWFGYGDNVAFFTLSRNGAPTGGNWGTASGTGSFYHPITKMGTEALKRLRLVELETENVPANYNFYCSVHRDGGVVANVGDAITANGVGECFWTAGTSDTAREIQLKTNWAAASGFSASTTAPGVKRVTLHAEALEEDADKIVCTVKLGLNAKEQKAIIDRFKNAGAVKLTNALSGVKETVVLYRRRYHSLEQRGNEPATAVCELRFRRSDTS